MSSNPLRGIGLTKPDPPPVTTQPTAEEIAAKEPDKEKIRRQRLAAMLAQGRASAMSKPVTQPTPSTSLGTTSGQPTLGA